MYHFGLYWHFYLYLRVSTSTYNSSTIPQAQQFGGCNHNSPFFASKATPCAIFRIKSSSAATITPPFFASKATPCAIFASNQALYVSWCLRPHWNRAKHRQIPTSRATLFPPIFGAAHRADRFQRYAVSPHLYNQQLEVSVHIFDLRTHNFMSSIRKRCGKANPSKAAILIHIIY